MLRQEGAGERERERERETEREQNLTCFPFTIAPGCR